MGSLLVLVYIFITLVAAYIAFQKINQYDMILMALSVVGVILSVFYNFHQKPTEHFVDYKPIELEENITPIKNNLLVYLTAFNNTSYKSDGKTWTNIIPTKPDGTCDTTQSNSMFNFELSPVFTRKSGFYLGNNRLVGPYCNALKIQFHNTFSFVFAVKHGNLLVEDTNNEIELFKLYGNSPNNNALSMYIQKNSLKSINNVQMGNLMFQYTNKDAQPCKLSKDHDMISFEKDVLTFYYVIKDTDHIRVMTMTEKNTNIDKLLVFNVENNDVTFSNKEFVINRLKNYNGSIYNLAVYNVALSDDDITNIHNHLTGEYMKYVNPNYIDIIKQYNETVSQLSQFSSCPYDKKVCDACSTVTKWNDMTQVLNSSAQCRNAINEFCVGNPDHALCKCWNSSTSQFNSDNCKMFRGIFTNDRASYLDTLSQSDIDYIMDKYKLIKPEDCPKPIKTPSFLKNKYQEYDLKKLKIFLDEQENQQSTNVKAKTLPADEDKYTWDRLKLENPTNPNRKPELTLSNLYKKDPETNYKLQETPSAIYNKIKTLAAAEKQAVQDTSSLNIVPQAAQVPTATSTTATTSQPPNSFFDSFMRVMLPE